MKYFTVVLHYEIIIFAEILRRLSVFTKFLHQEIKWNYSILCSVQKLILLTCYWSNLKIMVIFPVSVKYDRIRFFCDPYIPIWGQNWGFCPYTEVHKSEKSVFWQIYAVLCVYIKHFTFWQYRIHKRTYKLTLLKILICW